MSFMKDFDSLKIHLKDIRSATNDFCDMPIGTGGFGKVYKGELSLPEGRTIVAIKRLDRKHGQGDIEFWKEITMLSNCRHENLVSLLHFCNENAERILVYGYASHGSLDRYLGDTSLTWTQRLNICLGAARGLNYLHDPMNTQQRVLHRDIKSSNILLDENWNAKVSDFGLSKIGPANQQHTYLISNAVGTPGYCDPEYSEMGVLTKESDVYSFGVVLFEVLCGRLCGEYHNGELVGILVREWKKCCQENKLDDIIFHGLKEQIDLDSLKTFSSIANRCLNRDRKERPTMTEILEKLEIALDQQEISRDEEERIKFEERKRIASHAVNPPSCISRNELLLLLSEGILLDEGNTWFSINKNGKNCEMISARKCMFTYGGHSPWQDQTKGGRSRFPTVSCFTLNSCFQISVKTQFLSPHVTYTINLLYRNENPNQWPYVPFKYKLDEETKYSTSFLAQRNHEDWLSVELYQFTSYQKEHYFGIEFQSQYSHYQQHDQRFLLEGIEFRPVEYDKDENKVDMQPIVDHDIDWEQKLPSEYAEIIKWSKDRMQWTTMKELYHLLRKGVLINKSGEEGYEISSSRRTCKV